MVVKNGGELGGVDGSRGQDLYLAVVQELLKIRVDLGDLWGCDLVGKFVVVDSG